MYNGEYEIANAHIKPCEEQWKVSTSDLDYQMHFGKPTIVERVKNDERPILPQYRSIAQIPKRADPNDKYDIAAIVLFVEDKPRRIVREQGHVICVREITVIDHSTEQPLIISAWNDLAEDECDLLMKKTEQLPVVGFTALKVSPHKGFSMTTTMSTTIQHAAVGERPRSLEDWVANHNIKLCEIQARILTLKGLFAVHQTSTIAALRMKKAQTTLQDERITFNCEVSDGTGTLPITVFTADAEKIFQALAEDIFRMKHSENLTRFEAMKSKLQTTPFSIKVGPNTTLSMNNVLQWVLKKIIQTAEPPLNSPTA
ncbi:replication protein A 70 kDa DNA-binding subunit D-like [Silene latifolia]|uniref:replication protein A 70 kDa DNA-binding subunit D-like n=1 Tax=Silene latifolia TaxID=37657 RepID=UPI003D782CAA